MQTELNKTVRNIQTVDKDSYIESTILLMSNNNSADFYTRNFLKKQMLSNKNFGFVQSLNIDPSHIPTNMHQISIREVNEESNKTR
jgi:hypothetical protein